MTCGLSWAFDLSEKSARNDFRADFFLSGEGGNGPTGIFCTPLSILTVEKEVSTVSQSKKAKCRQGRNLKGSSPIAGINPTDPKRSAQDPMADPLEMRMKRESHQM